MTIDLMSLAIITIISFVCQYFNWPTIKYFPWLLKLIWFVAFFKAKLHLQNKTTTTKPKQIKLNEKKTAQFHQFFNGLQNCSNFRMYFLVPTETAKRKKKRKTYNFCFINQWNKKMEIIQIKNFCCFGFFDSS